MRILLSNLISFFKVLFFVRIPIHGRYTGSVRSSCLCTPIYERSLFHESLLSQSALSIKIGNVTLKNRICVAPMNLREVDHNGGYTARTIAFNEKFAKGGVALITMGETCVSQKTGASESFMLRITNPGAYFSLCDLAETVHRWGAKISMEMSHAGALCIPENNFGNQPMSAIDYVKPSGVAVRAMTLSDMVTESAKGSSTGAPPKSTTATRFPALTRASKSAS